MTASIAELKHALQPLLDASLRYPSLAGFVPRVQIAVLGVEEELKNLPAPAGDRLSMAIAEIEKGAEKAPTARKYGLAPSTVFRALKRRRDESNGIPADSCQAPGAASSCTRAGA